MTDHDTEMHLIATAMADVRVIVCPRCQGYGEVGLHTLPATCPRCQGSGRTTTTEAPQ